MYEGLSLCAYYIIKQNRKAKSTLKIHVLKCDHSSHQLFNSSLYNSKVNTKHQLQRQEAIPLEFCRAPLPCEELKDRNVFTSHSGGNRIQMIGKESTDANEAHLVMWSWARNPDCMGSQLSVECQRWQQIVHSKTVPCFLVQDKMEAKTFIIMITFFPFCFLFGRGCLLVFFVLWKLSKIEIALCSTAHLHVKILL